MSETDGKKPVLLAITNHSFMFWQFRRELMEELQKTYEVIISTPYEGHEDDFKALGFTLIKTNVDRRGLHPRADFKLFRTYQKMMKDLKPAMVVTYSIKPNVYGGWAARLAKIPCCVNVQGLGTAFQYEPIASVASILYRGAIKKAKAVFFENEESARVFEERKIVKGDKVTVLPGAGVNLDYYEYQPYPKHKGIRFLYLGRIMKEKGMNELFWAAKKLHEEFGSKVRLDLAGFFEEEYQGQVEELVSEGAAIFHGFAKDSRQYYQSADCVVLPSYHEGMSNVLLEACATGRAIITSDIPGCREAVEEGKNGFLCKPADRASLLEAMRKFVLLSSKEREAMGQYGREKMAREFNRTDVVEKTARIIKESTEAGWN